MLINMVGSGVDIEELSRAAEVRCHVTPIVVAETHHVAGADETGSHEPIDVEALVHTERLGLVPMEECDLETFVALAREVDDGEAATIALAVSRGWPIATDDRRAARLSDRRGLARIGTSSIFHAWAATVQLHRAQMALESIETRARYRPRVDDPHHAWWEGQRGRT